MAYSRTRARDSDRDKAMEVVGAAFADGQLSREEHDVRVSKLHNAKTFADLDEQLVDLQTPGETNWRAPVGLRSPGVPVRTRLVISGVAVAAVVGFSVVLPHVFSSDADRAPTNRVTDTPTTEPEQPAAIKDPRTPDGYGEFLAAMSAKLGTTKMTRAYLSESSVTVTVPVSPDRSRRYITWSWDGEWSEYSTGQYSESDEIWSLDLKKVDSSTFGSSMERSLAKVEDAESASFSIEPDGKSCYNIYVDNRFDESYYARFACDGKLVQEN